MDGVPVCDKCGLRAVRHELERQGVTLRFCDYCYWGELEVEKNALSGTSRETNLTASAKGSREE